MNADPDSSAAYVVLETNWPGSSGHGLTFTIGRGNEIVCAAAGAMRHLVVGRTLEESAATPGAFWRHLKAIPNSAGSDRTRGRCTWPRRR